MDTDDFEASRNLSLEELLEKARREEEMEQLGTAPAPESTDLLEDNDAENDIIEDLLEVSEQKKKKTRKPTEKLTEEKLLAGTGFPELLKLIKGRKFRHSKVYITH
jgi:hypothetical protein